MGTEAYLELTDAVGKVTPVIDHESFASKSDPPAVAGMIRDVFMVLKELLGDDQIASADRDLYHRGNSTEWTGWLDGPGARDTLRDLNGILGVAYTQDKLGAHMLPRFRSSVTELVTSTLKHAAAGNGPGPTQPLREALHRLEELGREEATGLLDDIREQQKKAAESARAASTAAGITGDIIMSKYYVDLAKGERRAANMFRGVTILVALAAAGVTGLFVAGHNMGLPWLDIAAGDYVHLIQRAVFVAGLFGVAGYFARQAHQHRSMANWAGALAVQLKTFDAYVAAVEDGAVKDELRKSFAARAFGDHPAMKGEPTVTPSAAAMDTAVGWAAKLTSGGK